ncbi:hypothetical protein [Lacticaseibacillus jixiensis]|uniref:hypothetical protein n=1 Tax=Lacticaseibacillus jixiensis TaxID=3231926 RepID=UPI0036F2D248
MPAWWGLVEVLISHAKPVLEFVQLIVTLFVSIKQLRTEAKQADADSSDKTKKA